MPSRAAWGHFFAGSGLEFTEAAAIGAVEAVETPCEVSSAEVVIIPDSDAVVLDTGRNVAVDDAVAVQESPWHSSRLTTA